MSKPTRSDFLVPSDRELLRQMHIAEDDDVTPIEQVRRRPTPQTETTDDAATA